jgi:CRP-like cAMP-binding protein
MAITPELLSRFPILRPLPQETLEELAICSSMHKFMRRGIVLHAGKKEDSLCFLFEGRLQGVDFTIDGREVGLYFVEPGDFCGELYLFDEGPQPEFVISLTRAIVVNVPVKAMQKVMLDSPGIVNLLGARLASRVRQLTRQRSLLGLPNIMQRVCCQLWLLVPSRDRVRMAPTEINNPPTHMEIAIMLNLSRESVTRVFQALQTKNIVRRDGPSRLMVIDLATLKNFAEGNEEI